MHSCSHASFSWPYGTVCCAESAHDAYNMRTTCAKQRNAAGTVHGDRGNTADGLIFNVHCFLRCSCTSQVLLCCTGTTARQCRSGKIDLRSNETARVSSGPASSIGIPRREHCTPARKRVNIGRVCSRAAVGMCGCNTSLASGKVRFCPSYLLIYGLHPSRDAGALGQVTEPACTSR